MPKWAKILLAVVGIGFVLTGVAGYAGYKWLANTYEKLEQSTEQAGAAGQALGSSGTLDDCLQELVHRSAGAKSPIAIMTSTPFAWGCLEAAPYDASFCDDVPDVGNERAMRSWSTDQCNQHGASGHDLCALALTPVASFCTAQRS